jgi:hypothetical protein
MAAPNECTGTMILFTVPADARFPDEGTIAECSDCGYVTITGGPLDERHRDAQVIRAD